MSSRAERNSSDASENRSSSRTSGCPASCSSCLRTAPKVRSSSLARVRLDDIDAGPHRTLFDRRRILDGVTFRGERVDPVDQEAAALQVLFWFWHELSHFIAAIGRGHLWWAAGQLEALRGCCVNLARLEQGAVVGDEPYEKVDLAIRTAVLSPLESTFVPIDGGALLEAGRTLVSHFRDRAPDVAEAYGLHYPVELEHLVCARLDAL